MELAQVLLETPQLGVAERSPIAAVENQHDCAMAFQQIRRSYLFSGGVLKGKGRRGLARTQRTPCRWDLLPKVENGSEKETAQKHAPRIEPLILPR
jgi:hypothetical protein